MIFVHTCKKIYWFVMYVNDRQHAAEFDHCDHAIVVERRGHVDGDR
jgi:hypothetical protein